MSTVSGYARIAFVASTTPEAQEARIRLVQRYGDTIRPTLTSSWRSAATG